MKNYTNMWSLVTTTTLSLQLMYLLDHTLVKSQTIPLRCVFQLSSINGYQLMNGHVCGV